MGTSTSTRTSLTAQRLVAVMAVTAASLVVGAPEAVAGHCSRVDMLPKAQLSVGEEKIWSQFYDTSDTGVNVSGDHVPNGFGADDDFGANCSRSIASDNSTLRQVIPQSASSPGDVNVYRPFDAAGGQNYTATAKVNLWGHDNTDFRAQLQLSAWDAEGDDCIRDSNGKCWEKRANLCTALVWTNCDAADDDTWKTLEITNVNLPSGTKVVKVNLRAKWRPIAEDAYGTAGLRRLTLKRHSN